MVLAPIRKSVEAGLAIARDARDSRARQRLVRANLAALPARPLTEDERAEGERFLSQFSSRYRNLDWHEALAAAHDGFEPGHIPEDIYFVAIHPALNPRDRQPAVANKNALDGLSLPLRVPETVARIVRGRLVAADHRPLSSEEAAKQAAADGATEVVLKRAFGSRAGKDVQFVAPSDLPGAVAPLLDRQRLDDDWAVQRVVQQCDAMAAFNPGSVNTLRIMTYRSKRGVIHVSSVVRMGRAGSRVDNQSSGGVACGVDEGTLRPIGHMGAGHLGYERLESHPDSGVRFAGYRVPSWREAVDACVAGHEMIPQMDLISWDIAVDREEQPTLIELNTVEQGIRIHQLENGPLPPEVVAEWASRARFWVVGGLVIRKPSLD